MKYRKLINFWKVNEDLKLQVRRLTRSIWNLHSREFFHEQQLCEKMKEKTKQVMKTYQ